MEDVNSNKEIVGREEILADLFSKISYDPSKKEINYKESLFQFLEGCVEKGVNSPSNSVFNFGEISNMGHDWESAVLKGVSERMLWHANARDDSQLAGLGKMAEWLATHEFDKDNKDFFMNLAMEQFPEMKDAVKWVNDEQQKRAKEHIVKVDQFVKKGDLLEDAHKAPMGKVRTVWLDVERKGNAEQDLLDTLGQRVSPKEPTFADIKMIVKMGSKDRNIVLAEVPVSSSKNQLFEIPGFVKKLQDEFDKKLNQVAMFPGLVNPSRDNSVESRNSTLRGALYDIANSEAVRRNLVYTDADYARTGKYTQEAQQERDAHDTSELVSKVKNELGMIATLSLLDMEKQEIRMSLENQPQPERMFEILGFNRAGEFPGADRVLSENTLKYLYSQSRQDPMEESCTKEADEMHTLAKKGLTFGQICNQMHKEINAIPNLTRRLEKRDELNLLIGIVRDKEKLPACLDDSMDFRQICDGSSYKVRFNFYENGKDGKLFPGVVLDIPCSENKDLNLLLLSKIGAEYMNDPIFQEEVRKTVMEKGYIGNKEISVNQNGILHKLAHDKLRVASHYFVANNRVEGAKRSLVSLEAERAKESSRFFGIGKFLPTWEKANHNVLVCKDTIASSEREMNRYMEALGDSVTLRFRERIEAEMNKAVENYNKTPLQEVMEDSFTMGKNKSNVRLKTAEMTAQKQIDIKKGLDENNL